MKILITGASGLIGRDLTKILSKKYKVVAIYKSKSFKKIKNVIWVKIDFTKKKNLKIPKFNFSLIINCAIDQKYKDKNFSKYKETNLNLINNLLNYVLKNNVNLFLNLSSIDVYGEVNKKILIESYRPRKVNAYGKIKSLCEKKIERKKINYLNLRLPGVLCDPSLNNLERTWLNSVFENFLKKKKIKIHNINNYFNNLTTTDEIARFIDFLIKKKISTKGTFNFACTKPIKLKDLIYSSKKIMNSSSKIEIIKTTKKKSFEISTKKLRKRFQFSTKPTKVIVEKYLKNLIHEKRNA